jgi:hypothetical protein
LQVISGAVRKFIKSLYQNKKWACFRAKGWMARRDERAYPWWICERGATKPDGLLRENPPGGASFAHGRRWLVAYSPLWGCSQLAALAMAKIRCRRPAFYFDTGSKS